MGKDNIMAKMRARSGAVGGGTPAPQGPSAGAKQGKPSGPRPPKLPLPVDHLEAILHVCGHPGQCPILKGQKPEHAAIRLQKWQAKRCPACVAAADRAIHEAAVQRKKDRRAKRPNRGGKPKLCNACRAVVPAHRLPDGSAITTVYDAGKELWTGTLSVVEGQEGAGNYSAEDASLFRLHQKLDTLWQDAAFAPGQRPYELAKAALPVEPLEVVEG